MSYKFWTTCVGLSDSDHDTLRDFSRMCEESIQITYDEFLELVDESSIKEHFPQYDWEGALDGIQLSRDRYVGFFTSTFRGSPVAFIDWSRIEHVWIKT